jgi:hypothetical protein
MKFLVYKICRVPNSDTNTINIKVGGANLGADRPAVVPRTTRDRFCKLRNDEFCQHFAVCEIHGEFIILDKFCIL